MMYLSDIEKFILFAEKYYRTTQEKLDYVNKNLEKSNSKTIQKSQYYKILGKLNSKTHQHASRIADNLLCNLVNEHDTLLEHRIECRELYDNALKDGKWSVALNIKKEQIDLGRRISSVGDLIYYLVKDLSDYDDLGKLNLEYLFMTESFR